MYGTIEKIGGGCISGLRIRVSGCAPFTFCGYSRREAISMYRRMNGLERRRICWLDLPA